MEEHKEVCNNMGQKASQVSKCQICSQEMSKNELQDHMFAHTLLQENEEVQQQFSCQQCTQKFYSKNELDDHKMAHQFEQEEQQQGLEERKQQEDQNQQQQQSQRNYPQQAQVQGNSQIYINQPNNQIRITSNVPFNVQQSVNFQNFSQLNENFMPNISQQIQQTNQNIQSQIQQQMQMAQQQMQNAQRQAQQAQQQIINIQPLQQQIPYQGQSQSQQIYQSFPGGRSVSRIVYGPQGVQIQQQIIQNDSQQFVQQPQENNPNLQQNQNVQLENLPVSFYQAPESNQQQQEADDQCMVCLSQFQNGEELRTLICFHKFHKECIDDWFNRKTNCPICNLNQLI